jgi:uncharacterized membrane protein
MTPIVAVHLAAAAIGLVLGAVQLARRKGTPSHRAIGFVYVAALVVASVGSFGIQAITHGHGCFSIIHILAVWTLISLAVALIAIRRGNINLHRGFMVGAYIGLIAAGIGAVAVPGRVLYVFFFGR